MGNRQGPGPQPDYLRSVAAATVTRVCAPVGEAPEPDGRQLLTRPAAPRRRALPPALRARADARRGGSEALASFRAATRPPRAYVTASGRKMVRFGAGGC